jgi:hypothetical protein
MGSPRVALRRVGIVLGGTALVVLIASLVAPIGPGADGATFCYPILGPVQRFEPGLSDPLLGRVRAHERAHADQCRRDGALWHTLHRLVPRQRVLSEAEAYCAEVRYGIANGGQARLLYAEVLDELRERPWFKRFSTAALAEALASWCPTIARTAAREEAEWQVRLKARRPH